MIPTTFSHPPVALRRREDGNAFIVVIIFIAIFSIVVGACYVLSDETNRRTARENHYVAEEVVADAAMDVLYGRFSQWVNAHTGITPSVTDAATTTTYGNISFAPITSSISFAGVAGLSDYTVSLGTGANASPFYPVNPDDTSTSVVNATFPNAALNRSDIRTYQKTVDKYYSLIPNIYEPTTYSKALTYKATVTITSNVNDSQHPSNPITFSRYFQSSQVTPFAYNVFTEGSFEDTDWGQSFDSEASIYASVKVQMDHKGTIINGPIRYGGSFVDPDGNVNGVSDLVFQDPTTGATVDPYTSGLLRQVSKIEVVPDIQDVIAHNSDGTRSASAETATATVDNFSRRELIEPPANLTGDTAPDQIAQRRIYTQADLRLKVSVGTKVVVSGKANVTVPAATGTFYNLDGSVRGQYTGIITGPTTTTWTATSGGDSVTGAVINAVNVNTVSSSAPFYDVTRTSDITSNYSNLAGQPTSTNNANPIESVDVNVGRLTAAINANPASFNANTLYVWDDGASGEKNGVRLWNGGTLPQGTTQSDGSTTPNGLTVGSTNPVYIKGDYNTGTVLADPTNIDSATKGAVPAADTTGWNGGNMVSTSDRALPGYTPQPSGVFGDTITTISQSWRDSASNNNTNPTQSASSTTYNTVMGFGSGDANSLQADDSFSSGRYSFVQTLEYWNNARWNQLGEQMSLYHSLYSRQHSQIAWVSPGHWAVIQNDFDAGTAKLPLNWGYLVFSRGRLVRN